MLPTAVSHHETFAVYRARMLEGVGSPPEVGAAARPWQRATRERPLAHAVARRVGRVVCSVVLSAVLLSCGCRRTQPVAFRLNFEGRDPAEIGLLEQEAIAEALDRFFGTPDDPRVPEGVELDSTLLHAAAGPVVRYEDRIDPGALPAGRRGLYRQHCAMCHGISGDGAGPAAIMQNPYPRDFRYGVFKYTSTIAGAKPIGADLKRTLRQGIPGTAMPSFRWLDERSIDTLVEYVKYLAIRGESEQYVVQLVLDEDEPIPLNAISRQIILDEAIVPLAEAWSLPEHQPDQFVVVPPDPVVDDSSSAEQWARSIELGRSLYAAGRAQCVKCHGAAGDGNGEQDELYDDWNERKRGVTQQQTAQRARLFRLPLQRLRPRDFREGIFHGGGSAEQLYLRIHVGVKGTPMAGVGPSFGNPGALEPEEIWHVVAYVRWLAGQVPRGATHPAAAHFTVGGLQEASAALGTSAVQGGRFRH